MSDKHVVIHLLCPICQTRQMWTVPASAVYPGAEFYGPCAVCGSSRARLEPTDPPPPEPKYRLHF